MANGAMGGGGEPKLSPRDRMKLQRNSVKDLIYSSANSAFSPAILDCIAGRESGWDPTADNRLGFRGMYQMGKAAWTDAFANSGTEAPPYLPNVFDAATATAATDAYLSILLIRQVGKANWFSGNFTPDDIRTVIENYNGEQTKAQYADQILNCAKAMVAGDVDGAFAAIGK